MRKLPEDGAEDGMRGGRRTAAAAGQRPGGEERSDKPPLTLREPTVFIGSIHEVGDLEGVAAAGECDGIEFGRAASVHPPEAGKIGRNGQRFLATFLRNDRKRMSFHVGGVIFIGIASNAMQASELPDAEEERGEGGLLQLGVGHQGRDSNLRDTASNTLGEILASKYNVGIVPGTRPGEQGGDTGLDVHERSEHGVCGGERGLFGEERKTLKEGRERRGVKRRIHAVSAGVGIVRLATALTGAGRRGCARRPNG